MKSYENGYYETQLTYAEGYDVSKNWLMVKSLETGIAEYLRAGLIDLCVIDIVIQCDGRITIDNYSACIKQIANDIVKCVYYAYHKASSDCLHEMNIFPVALIIKVPTDHDYRGENIDQLQLEYSIKSSYDAMKTYGNSVIVTGILTNMGVLNDTMTGKPVSSKSLALQLTMIRTDFSYSLYNRIFNCIEESKETIKYELVQTTGAGSITAELATLFTPIKKRARQLDLDNPSIYVNITNQFLRFVRDKYTDGIGKMMFILPLDAFIYAFDNGGLIRTDEIVAESTFCISSEGSKVVVVDKNNQVMKVFMGDDESNMDDMFSSIHIAFSLTINTDATVKSEDKSCTYYDLGISVEAESKTHTEDRSGCKNRVKISSSAYIEKCIHVKCTRNYESFPPQNPSEIPHRVKAILHDFNDNTTK